MSVTSGYSQWDAVSHLLFIAQFWQYVSTGFSRILENPGKSWNIYWKISRTWKVLENDLGPGKYGNLLGNDEDDKTLLAYDRVLENAFGGLESAGKVLEFIVTKRVGTLDVQLMLL